jgi:hypothetical protein
VDRRLLLDGFKETMPKKTADTYSTYARKWKVRCVLAFDLQQEYRNTHTTLLAIPALLNCSAQKAGKPLKQATVVHHSLWSKQVVMSVTVV